jgi:hypothetical protein
MERIMKSTTIARLLAATIAMSFIVAGPAHANKTKPEKICPDLGDWVYDGTEWTLDGENEFGSRKFDTNNDPATVGICAPEGYYLDDFCTKAGKSTLDGYFDPPVACGVLSDPSGQDISHFSLSFVLITEDEDGEWCSPGFWRNNARKWNASQWPVATDTPYSDILGAPTVAGTPTLLQVLQSPQTYGGAAFNAVGDYLSVMKSLNVQYDDDDKVIRVNNCPLSQQTGD